MTVDLTVSKAYKTLILTLATIALVWCIPPQAKAQHSSAPKARQDEKQDKKKTVKKDDKQTTKKVAKEASKKATKKTAAKQATKTTTKKATEKTAKKATKKATKKPATKKTAKKATKQATKKTAKQATKKSATKKTAKKASKKPTKRAIAKKASKPKLSQEAKLYLSTTKAYQSMLGQQIRSKALDKQKAEFAAKLKAYQQLSKTYLQLTTMKDKAIAVCALVRLGIGSDELAEAVSEAPLPQPKGKKWSKKEAQTYQANLENTVIKKYRAQSIQYIKKAVALAKQAKVNNDCVRNAKQILKHHAK